MTDNEIKEHIQELRVSRKAIILAHNYQPAVIQDIADLTGDSLELSRRAARTEAEVIVFCGVHFMAETAAILNPQKTVLLPNIEAGCRMADMVTPRDMIEVKKQYPGVPIIQYVNSSAAVKAESTVCCTSANVVKVVESFKDADKLYLSPDQNLAKYAASKTGKDIDYWHGYCPVHHNLTTADVLARKREHPKAIFLAHPECTPEVLALADEIASTSGMIRFVTESTHQSFIIGTEIGILHPIRKQNPSKTFYPASRKMVCPNMKKITLKHVLLSLEMLQPKVSVPEDIRLRALATVEKMLAIS